MSTPAAWEVLARCAHCQVEGAAIELMDPSSAACRFATPVTRICQCCGRHEEADPEPVSSTDPGGCPRCGALLADEARHGEAGCSPCGYRPILRLRHPGDALHTEAAALAALARFAAHHGADDPAEFCEANLGGDLAATQARLQQGLPIASSLDVLAFLFPGASGGGSAEPTTSSPRLHAPVTPPAPLPAASPPDPDPLQAAKLLASIAVADGDLRSDERAFALTLLRREGWEELGEEHWRVFRPWETGPRPSQERAEMLLEAAVQLSHLDHERDESEWKVLVAYALAWGVPQATLRAFDDRWAQRHTTRLTQLLTWLNTQVRLH